MADTKMYLVTATDENGENIDQFVEALNGPDAEIVWRDFREEDAPLSSKPRIFLIPKIKGVSRVIEWGCTSFDVVDENSAIPVKGLE